MDAIVELIDFKRRIQMESDENDYVFAQHLMQEEYLNQVFLLALAEKWQGELFNYTGRGKERIDAAGRLIDKADMSLNPLGIASDRVYFKSKTRFENEKCTALNWQNYYQNVQEALGTVKGTFDTAITQLQNSLADRNAFTTNAVIKKHQFEEQIEQLCGPDTAQPETCHLDQDGQLPEATCDGPECMFEYQCEIENETCNTVARIFKEETDNVVCRMSEGKPWIKVGQKDRMCARGQMGALLQEKVMLEIHREEVTKKVELLMRQISGKISYLEDTKSGNTQLMDDLKKLNKKIRNKNKSIRNAQLIYDLAMTSADAISPNPLGAQQAGAKALAITGKFGLTKSDISALEKAEQERSSKLTQFGLTETERRLVQELNEMKFQVDALVSEYRMYTQQLANLRAKILDNHALAQNAANRASESVANIADHLVGFESGDVMLRNQMIHAARRCFQELLYQVYELTQAFVHYHNIPSEKEEWHSRLYRLTTPGDVEKYIADMQQRAKDICDFRTCQDANNANALVFSVRNNLFPWLTDIVGSGENKTLTKGQRFHNIITSSDYIKKRRIGGKDVEQIEIPFAIWLPGMDDTDNKSQNRFHRLQPHVGG